MHLFCPLRKRPCARLVGGIEHICFAFAWSTFIACLLGSSWVRANSLPQASAYFIEPVDAWVKSVESPVVDQDDDVFLTQGIRYILNDFQINATQRGNSAFYHKYEFELTNSIGVENYSQIEIEFDPTYESLTLHELVVVRNGVITDKLQTAVPRILQREPDLDQLIYDGTNTLNVVLDDVRVGDRVRYAYTIRGDNPIFQGLREFRVPTQFSIPLTYHHARILHRSDEPFQIRRSHTDQELVHSRQGDVDVYVLTQRHVPAHSVSDGRPAWRNPRGMLVFSEIQSWQSVVEWALPMYALDATPSVDLLGIAESIRLENPDTASRIGAALQWVQNEVRYFGVEIGVNSHLPSRPEETLQRRFGDCKDKTLLTIALLHELGVAAQPALVNTTGRLRDPLYPFRLHAFDHVIVHIDVDGKSHWLDPTRSHQLGKLGEMFEPDYGQALVLQINTTELVSMKNALSMHQSHTEKQLRIGKNAEEITELTVESRLIGRSAERVRSHYANGGALELTAEYEKYYRKYFPNLISTAPVLFIEQEAARAQTQELYKIHEFWNSDNRVDEYHWLYADELQNYLVRPSDAVVRTEPYEIAHPVKITETWQVQLPYPMRLDDLSASEVNDYFAFHKTYELDPSETQLTVHLSYESRSNEIPAEDIQAYSAAVDRADDQANFYIENTEPETPVYQASVFKGGIDGFDEIPGVFWFLLGLLSWVLPGVIYLVHRRPAAMPGV